MRTIYKYTLKPQVETIIEMPAQSMILSAHEQNDEICLWVGVEPNGETISRKILVIGTGHPIPEVKIEFIDTVHICRGRYIFHVFELSE